MTIKFAMSVMVRDSLTRKDDVTDRCNENLTHAHKFRNIQTNTPDAITKTIESATTNAIPTDTTEANDRPSQTQPQTKADITS